MNAPPLMKEILIALVVATIVVLVSGTVIIIRLLRCKLAGNADLGPSWSAPPARRP